MKNLFLIILAFVTFSRLWASAETKRESLMNRIKNDPRLRALPSRKGETARTQSTQMSLAAEAVWGVEALDPLQQRAWAQALWQSWYVAAPKPKPLLLRYPASAERAALRALNTFARLGRSEETPPWIVLTAPAAPPLLAPPPVRVLSLSLIHRASRFVNLTEWLTAAAAAPACRVIMTMPYEEAMSSPAARSCEVHEIPEEDASYCAAVAAEIITKHFGALPPASVELTRLEQILIEAGRAQIAAPVSLLARHLQCEQQSLCAALQHSRLRAFVFWFDEKSERMLAFRGAWLARMLRPQQVNGEYDPLFAMMSALKPAVQAERNFLLHLLMALQAQGHRELAAQLQQEHARLFEQVREQLEACDEREAWANWGRL